MKTIFMMKMHNSTRIQTVCLRMFAAAVALAVLLIGMAKPVLSENKDANTSDRRVVTRIEPEYPETLKRLYIGGMVRVEVVVDANGRVESASLLGGNPILGQSALKAIKQWKYAPAVAKEKFVVQFEFDPHR